MGSVLEGRVLKSWRGGVEFEWKLMMSIQWGVDRVTWCCVKINLIGWN